MISLPLAHISWALADNEQRPACDAWFIDLFGAQTAHEIVLTPELEKYRLDREERLMVIGQAMIIPIAPAGAGAVPGQSPLGDMLRRSAGTNRWIGLSLRVANLKDADAWFTARGFKLHYDPGMENNYFLISKRQALGVRLELMQGELPGDPRLKDDWRPEWWRDDHPLGIEGLLSIDVSVGDLEQARDLFGRVLEWPELGERDLPGEDARGLAFHLGDTVIEALCPARDDTDLAAHVRDGQGICGMTFKVRSARAAADHLRARGFTLQGSEETRFAIVPGQAQGRLIWFAEGMPDGWPPLSGSLIRQPAVYPAAN